MTLILRGTDGALHSPEQAAALLEVPVLGVVQEIRSPGAEVRLRLWRNLVRPALGILLLAITAGSAALSYRHLADAEFSQSVRDARLGGTYFRHSANRRGAHLVSSISDALKRAQQERDRLRTPGSEPVAGQSPEMDTSLASVVLRKAPASPFDPSVAPPTSAVTPLADAIKNTPAAPPPAVRRSRKSPRPSSKIMPQNES